MVAKNVNVIGTGTVGGISGGYATLTNVIVKSGSVNGNSAYGIQGTQGMVNNSIIENLSIKKTSTNTKIVSLNYKESYYSNKVTVNGNVQTDGFDSSYIDNLGYYTGKVETINNGDKNNTGYYFDYVQSKNGIYLIKVK